MHIRLLLMAFFLKYFPDVVRTGHVYVLQTPLFRVRNKQKTVYCYSEEEKLQAIKSLGKKPEITRFKGLGEISPVYDTLFVHDTLRVHDTLVPMQTDSTGFYKFSAGLNVNVLGGGPSIKYGISKNCVFQTDFSGRFFINNYSPENSFILYVYELSQNFLYQRQIAEKNGVLYYYMVGAGLSGGVSILRPTLWKLGVYPLFGVEFVLKRPKLSFQIDL